MASSAPPTTTQPLALDARLVRPADDGAADGESTYLHLSVRPPAQHGARPNLHLVFVVDVSYSMSDAVESVAAGGQKESHGFTILDLVKHSLLTIVEALDPALHSVSIVSFADDARVELEAESLLVDGAKARVVAQIRALRERGGTNLWSGVKAAYRLLDDLHASRRSANALVGENNEVMLFTDGQPNNNPPRGHIPTLQEYVRGSVSREVLRKTVTRTYGFGYNLNAKLLEEIAATLDGNFCFIPDAGFVGTVFIHSMADVLSSLSFRDVRLELEFEVLHDEELRRALGLHEGNLQAVLGARRSHLQASFLGFGARGQRARLDHDPEAGEFEARDPLFALPEYRFAPDGSIRGRLALRVPGGVQAGQSRDFVLRHPLIQGLTAVPAGARGDGEAAANLRKRCLFEKLVCARVTAYDAQSDAEVSRTVEFPHVDNLAAAAAGGGSTAARFDSETTHKLDAGALTEMLRLDIAETLHAIVGGVGGGFAAEPPQHQYGHAKQKAPAVAGFAAQVAALIARYSGRYELTPDADLDGGVFPPESGGWVVAGEAEEKAGGSGALAGGEDGAGEGRKILVHGTAGQRKRFEALLQDLTGQCSEACESPEFFNKWGEYFLRSLGFAHALQKKNNFKDPGVQGYGGKEFRAEVNRVNDLFDNLAPPEPSKQQRQTYGAAPSAPQSMAMYNNSYGPCFGAAAVVTMRDGSRKQCSKVMEGDEVRTDGARGWNKIRKVIETRFVDRAGVNTLGGGAERASAGDGSADEGAPGRSGKDLPSMPVVKFNETGLVITPWHPVLTAKRNAVEALQHTLSTASTSSSSSASPPPKPQDGAAQALLSAWQFPMDLYLGANERADALEREVERLAAEARPGEADRVPAAVARREQQIKFLRGMYSLQTAEVVYNFLLESDAGAARDPLPPAPAAAAERPLVDAEGGAVNSRAGELQHQSNRPSALVRSGDFFEQELSAEEGGEAVLGPEAALVRDIHSGAFLPADRRELSRRRDARTVISELQRKSGSPGRRRAAARKNSDSGKNGASDDPMGTYMRTQASKMTNSSNEGDAPGAGQGPADGGHKNRSAAPANDMCIFVNGVRTCTLGHELDGACVRHAYFGDYRRVERDLMRTEEWPIAYKPILLDAGACLRRDPASGLVDGMTQRPGAEASTAATGSKNLGATSVSECGRVSIAARNDSKALMAGVIAGDDAGTPAAGAGFVAMPKATTITADNSNKRRRKTPAGDAVENQPSPRGGSTSLKKTETLPKAPPALPPLPDDFNFDCEEIAPLVSSDSVRPGQALMNKSKMGRALGTNKRKRGFGGMHGMACGCCEGKMRNQKALASQMRGMENL